ncbi:unnamed protein product [Didymodactylos carnosus]|uniref:Uncharacterized protein n=1 Tax=Didymodactylos carnosus TaxID=1234261 RepID=A0A813SAT0_9BILA|nr:unnamed protein product [Didymodactylos carnosus]CAF0793780.1 unnamed protein product [Didymodactylos carnosus]CAF3557823.1 unnamed protein product [Didymodactylos carnosus]CAF3578210.1 unnamed protein product [Didymodactylos carnosus]
MLYHANKNNPVRVTLSNSVSPTTAVTTMLPTVDLIPRSTNSSDNVPIMTYNSSPVTLPSGQTIIPPITSAQVLPTIISTNKNDDKNLWLLTCLRERSRQHREKPLTIGFQIPFKGCLS